MTLARGRRIGVLAAVAVASSLLLSSCLMADVRYLASDDLGGRDNGTPGSVQAQEHLLHYLRAWTDGANEGDGDDAYRQVTASGGTNLVGILPGSDLADEYVVVGAHYDHVGSSCDHSGPADSICNGATDNAAGVAAAIDILRWFAVNDVTPRRSIVFAFWDREEDGLRGSAAYLASPLVPIADTVAYVNFDIQGANLRPSLASSTFAIGAETGGPMLRQAVAAATDAGGLDTWQLSLIFGQGRSDHANFVNAGVPSVFFSDATGPCYHDVDDEIGVVDERKLTEQARSARRLVADLADRSDAPTPTTTGLPLTTYDDALVVDELYARLMDDLDLFTPSQQATLISQKAVIDQMAADGPDAFDSTDQTTLLIGTAKMANEILPSGPCDGFLPAG